MVVSHRASSRARTTKTRRRAQATPTLVLLVRHGRTPTTGKLLPGRKSGLHLSEAGQEQAARVADRIAEIARTPTAIYTSPLERAKETARPIARRLGLRVRTAPGLVDCDTGQWTGARLDRLARRSEWGLVRRWPARFRFPGGESFVELSARSFSAVVDLVNAHSGETVVAVSHADPIKAVVAAALGVPLDLLQRLVVSPCSVTALAFGSDGPTILCTNATDSLKELASA